MIYLETPVSELKSALLESARIKLHIKREDLNHPKVSGNKWWKLKYNLKIAIDEGHQTLLTFGGAYSNHLYATAAAAKELGLKSIGIVRGEEQQPLNPTLTFCKSMGMHLHYISREAYKRKEDDSFLESLREGFGDFYLIPEGGTNELAVRGCEEWALQLQLNTEFDYLCLPIGTGGTMAGMINGLDNKKIIGFSSLKGGEFLTDEVRKWVRYKKNDWSIETQYHFGGYGKVKNELLEFTDEFERTYQIPLDPIYTGKMMYGVFDLIEQHRFESGAKLLVLHTGGLQGRSGLNS